MVWFYSLNDLEGQAQSAAILITKTGRVPRYMPGENLKSVLMHICVNLRDSIPNLPYHINKLKLHTFFDKLFIQTRKWSFIHPMFLSAAVRWMDCTHPTPTTTPNPHHPHHHQLTPPPPPPPPHRHRHTHPTHTLNINKMDPLLHIDIIWRFYVKSATSYDITDRQINRQADPGSDNAPFVLINVG